MRNQANLIGVLMLLLVGCSQTPPSVAEPVAAVNPEVVKTKVVPEPVAESVAVTGKALEEEEEQVIRTSGVPPFRPFFDVLASLEETIVKSEVIARARLRSVEAAAAKLPWEQGESYAGSLRFTLDVLEYLKGTGGAQITAYAYGWEEDELWDNAFVAPTEAEAIALGRQLLEARDRRWDDREAVILLRRNQAHNHYYFGMVGPGATWPQFTVASDMFKAWLPEVLSNTITGRAVTPVEQRFLLDDPGNGTSTTVTRSTGPVASTGASISVSELRSQITELDSEYNGGDGSAEYKACVVAKYEWESLSKQKLARWGGSYNRPPDRHSLPSGQPAGRWIYEVSHARRDLAEYGETQPANWGQIFTEGRDRDLLVGDWPGVIKTARPLPAGEYSVYFLIRNQVHVPCDAYPEADRTREEHRLNVAAPAGTLAESFFDPYASSTAVIGTTTVGTISWQPPSAGSGQAGRVISDLTIDVTGHALDFIGLDGTTTLSLIVADATESAGTLTWTAPTQPWSAGDKLMLRVRRSQVP